MYNLGPFTFTYPNSDKKLTLDSKLTIKPGTCVAVVGPSGGGKTTLMKLLKGIIPEMQAGELEGEITYDNRLLWGSGFKENLQTIVYLFQNPFGQLIFSETEEEFLFSMENFNFTKEEMDKKGIELEKVFQLSALWGKKTSEISHGQCQKLVLASLLAINPEVMLLDEPCAFLDPESRMMFYTTLKEINKTRTTIIIDHYLDEIAHMIDQYIYVSESGQIEILSDLNKLKEHREANLTGLSVDYDFTSDVSLKLSNVEFSYQKKSPLLKAINLEIKKGETVCLKGKNGQGKSTLLKLMAGILKPNSGKIELSINQKIINFSDFYNHVGIVFQNPESHFYFDTIKEELDQNCQISIESRDAIIKAFFHELELEKSPFLLSEGEKRRLSILLTVLLGRGIIFYDEPTFGQDQKSINEITTIFNTLKKAGVTQVFISHDERFISTVADRVLVLNEGVIE